MVDPISLPASNFRGQSMPQANACSNKSLRGRRRRCQNVQIVTPVASQMKRPARSCSSRRAGCPTELESNVSQNTLAGGVRRGRAWPATSLFSVMPSSTTSVSPSAHVVSSRGCFRSRTTGTPAPTRSPRSRRRKVATPSAPRCASSPNSATWCARRSRTNSASGSPSKRSTKNPLSARGLRNRPAATRTSDSQALLSVLMNQERKPTARPGTARSR